MLGRTILSNSYVPPTRVSADGSPKYKAGGVTIDWSLVAALGSTYTFPDTQYTIASGLKMLRYGQVLTKVTTTGVFTATETGTPTGGTFTLVVTTPSGTVSTAQTTGTIAQAATATTVQTAIAALTNVGTGNVTVTGSAGGPYTITFVNSLGAVTLALGTNSLTGGSTPSVTIAQTGDAGGNTGWFGPYDPAATDGRATLTRGECFILDETVLQYSAGFAGVSVSNDQIGGVIEGGSVFIDRIIQSGVATHTLAVGPTKAELLAAFPALLIVED